MGERDGMMGNMQIIGQKIKQYRKMNSLTQKELAAEIGVTHQYIASIEQGLRGISLDKLVALCKFFNVSMADMMPLGEQDDTETKNKLIRDITGALGAWDTAQLRSLKSMICSIKG